MLTIYGEYFLSNILFHFEELQSHESQFPDALTCPSPRSSFCFPSMPTIFDKLKKNLPLEWQLANSIANRRCYNASRKIKWSHRDLNDLRLYIS